MAKRKMEYEITGKSDVEQVTGRAKASLSQLDQFAQTVGKKLGEFGKDFAMGFLAPMLLLNKAISFIAQKIEENKQKVKEARDYLTSEEGKGKGDPLIREFLRRSEEKAKAAATEEKIKIGRQDAIREFLETTPEGKAIVEREQARLRTSMGPGAGAGGAGVGATSVFLDPNKIATDPKIQEEVIKELRKRIAVEPEAATFAPAQGGNVIGVGQSALDMAVGEQTQIQKDILQMLRDHLPTRGQPPDPDLTNQPEATPTYAQKRSMRVRIPSAR